MQLNSKWNFNRKYTEDVSFFEKIDNPLKAKILGFIFADGTINKNLKYLRIELSEEDESYLKIIKESLQSNSPFHKRNRVWKGKQHSHVYWSVNNKKLVNDLILLGVYPNKTYTMRIPNLAPELLPHFISGYFEGDGCIYHHSNRNTFAISFVSGSKKFLSDLKKIVNKLDIKTKIEKTNSEKTYLLRISGNRQVLKFCEWMYENSPFVMSRKFIKVLSLKKIYE